MYTARSCLLTSTSRVNFNTSDRHVVRLVNTLSPIRKNRLESGRPLLFFFPFPSLFSAASLRCNIRRCKIKRVCHAAVGERVLSCFNIEIPFSFCHADRNSFSNPRRATRRGYNRECRARLLRLYVRPSRCLARAHALSLLQTSHNILSPGSQR